MSAISNLSRFVEYPLNARRSIEQEEKEGRQSNCGYCLQDDDEFRDSQINRATLPNLQNRGIEHLRNDRVCHRMHAACLRAAAQIGAAQNMQRPLSCPECLQEITSVNGVPIGQYLNLDRLPGPHLGNQEPIQIGEADEEVVLQGGVERGLGEEGPQVEGNNNADGIRDFGVIDLAFENIIDFFGAMERVQGRDREHGRIYFMTHALAKRWAAREELFTYLRTLRDRELVVGIRGALNGAVEAQNVDLLRTILEDPFIKRNTSLEMRGEAITNMLRDHLLARNLVVRQMFDLLLPAGGRKLSEASLGKAVCAAASKRSEQFVELLLSHGQIGDYYRGKALCAAIKSIGNSFDNDREAGVRLVRLILANGNIPDRSLESALSNAISQSRVDIRIARDLIALQPLSQERKRLILEQAIDANRRDLVQDLSRELSFKERSSALWFAMNSESIRNANWLKAPFDRGIYSTLADLKIKSAFYGAIGFSVAYLARQAYRVNFK